MSHTAAIVLTFGSLALVFLASCLWVVTAFMGVAAYREGSMASWKWILTACAVFGFAVCALVVKLAIYSVEGSP